MGIDHMERLAAGDSPVHRLHAMAKLVTTVVYIIAVISFPLGNISGLMPFFIYPLLMMPLSGTPYRPLLGRLLIALPFSFMGGLGNLLFMGGEAFRLGGVIVSLGAAAFASIMLKTALSVFAALILIATTSFFDIGGMLALLRVPKVICLQLVMTYRYVSVLIVEAASMFTAYALRAPGQKGIKMKDMSSFAGQLILRSIDRAERVYRAMQCRGFEGVYMDGRNGRARASDWAYAVVFTLGVVFLRYFNLGEYLGKLFG